MRERRHWPKLTPDQVATVVDFLAWYRAVAETGAMKASELASMQPEELGMQGNAAWWAMTVKSIDWLLHRVPMRQQYLEIQLAQREKRWQPTDKKPAT